MPRAILHPAPARFTAIRCDGIEGEPGNRGHEHDFPHATTCLFGSRTHSAHTEASLCDSGLFPWHHLHAFPIYLQAFHDPGLFPPAPPAPSPYVPRRFPRTFQPVCKYTAEQHATSPCTRGHFPTSHARDPAPLARLSFPPAQRMNEAVVQFVSDDQNGFVPDVFIEENHEPFSGTPSNSTTKTSPT